MATSCNFTVIFCRENEDSVELNDWQTVLLSVTTGLCNETMIINI